MCFSSDQHPPEPPKSSDVGDHGPLVLTAGDGNRFSAFEAVPVTPRGASLVLLPDIRGMHAFYTDLASCCAQAGIDTVVSLGFCMFGGQSWRLAATDLRPAGSIGFYGRPSTVEDVVGDLDAPLLILAAGDDKATSAQENATFVHSLDEAGKVYEYTLYEGAPHSFFDRGYEQWRTECADAWAQMLAFIDRNR